MSWITKASSVQKIAGSVRKIIVITMALEHVHYAKYHHGKGTTRLSCCYKRFPEKANSTASNVCVCIYLYQNLSYTLINRTNNG